MKLDEERDRVLNSADQNTADQYQRFLCNRGGCFLTNGVPRAINVTLLPTPVSRQAYNHLVTAQEPLNKLIELSSRDVEFVKRTIAPCTKVDYLAKRLLEIYLQCSDEDQITLGMYRHDYMFHCPDPSGEDAIHNGAFKMVEANLMSAALLGTGTHAMELHNQVLARELPGREQPYEKSLRPMVRGVATAWGRYERPDSVFLFLVAPDDFNWFDQQKIIDTLWDEHGIMSMKMTYEEFMEEGELTSDNRYYVRGKEVGVFYFRSMWNEDHYKTERHWETRLRIEKCRAIVVPNIRHQCINLKYFQQAYLQQGVVEKYLSEEESKLVRSVFAELHQLSPGKEGDRAAQLAFDNPKGWVLKPSREGGGNNIWDEDMVKKLTELHNSAEREAYVLMQRLTPPLVPNRAVKHEPNERAKLTEIFDTTGELGLFCVFVADSKKQILVNEVAGPLIRTKPAANNEGGIAIGIGVMDSAVFAD
ncbi:hypothetical protein ACHWQZ_G003233 [Mnemiopsis leidyi]